MEEDPVKRSISLDREAHTLARERPMAGRLGGPCGDVMDTSIRKMLTFNPFPIMIAF